MCGRKHIGNLGDVNPVHGSRYVYAPRKETAESCGTSLKELRRCFCSADAMDLAYAWCCVGDYYGFENLDDEPWRLTEAELEARYADES